jgi:hypothetical protein
LAVEAPTVAMIHATPAAIGPAVGAFAERFPEASPWHLLDDRLSDDADRAGGLTPALRRRMLSLIAHAVGGGADAVLLTCSMYGPVARVASTLWEPHIAASDQAMHEQIRAAAPRRLLLLASLESAAADAARRLAETLGDATELTAVSCPGAAAAASSDDKAALLESLLSVAGPAVGDVDGFVLCQYSLTPSRAALEAAVSTPVFSPPHLAADALRARLGFKSATREPVRSGAVGR